MFFGFLMAVQLARLLGPEGYGLYGVSMSLIALLCVPIEFGLPDLLTREVATAHARSEWGRIHSLLRWARKVTAVVFAVVLLGVLVWHLATRTSFDSEGARTTLVGLLLIPLVALCNQKSAALRGMQMVVRGQFPNVLIRPAAFSLLLFIVTPWRGMHSSTTAMGLGALSAGIALVVASFLLEGSLPRASSAGPITAGQARAWLSSSVPMALNEGMRVLQGNLVVLVMAAVSGAALVGLFRVASSMSLLFAVPGTLLGVVSASQFARLHSTRDASGLQRLSGMVVLAMVLFSGAFVFPLWLAGDWFVAVMFGAGFEGASRPLLVLALGMVASAIAGPAVVLLNMTGFERRVTRAFTWSLVLLCLTVWPLVYYWGEVGGAVAVSLANFVWNVMAAVDARRLLSIQTSMFYWARPSVWLDMQTAARPDESVRRSSDG